MRILVSGGGTAGHISPILATVDALKSLDKSIQFLYVGQKGGMEDRIAVAAGLEFAAIRAGKFRRYHDVSRLNKLLNPSMLGPNVRDLSRVVSGVGTSLRILRRWQPDVIFIKGGYVGLPVGVAARILRLPYIIHESDLTPGLANRLLSKGAERIAVAFPAKSYHDFPPDRLVFTGNPVRPELLNAHRLEGLKHFKLESDVPVILVTGGSQGALALNQAVLEALPRLVERYQIIHLTGEPHIERTKFEVKRLGAVPHLDRYHPFAFLMGDMGMALAAADLAISRAGANTIAELAALRKPTILVPNYLAAGHQVANATFLARQGAVKVLPEPKLTGTSLLAQITQILDSAEEQQRLEEGIAKFAKPDASLQLAKLIYEIGELNLRTNTEQDSDPGEQ